ncbi:MAG: methylated-DNA--[protein]-cysteine S-methyltransferase [Spirochaetaceae bacterium]|jgi:methylated-DNA-[protein]-cysteine S-methyltransferase|nr:methylated-DNA--[protein]-cysteine S-methyltransferase [Spirochaetaceae bacterium]
MKSVFFYESPVGPLGIVEEEGAISGVFFFRGQTLPGFSAGKTPVLQRAAAQLAEYFTSRRRVFDLPLVLRGTAFQVSVWKALQSIPPGETRSYEEVAVQIGNPKACRAVGMANNRNPIAIIVPCHRVIGKDGSLTGYGGGLDIKRYLLTMEKEGVFTPPPGGAGKPCTPGEKAPCSF